jgi:hypothetical protein
MSQRTRGRIPLGGDRVGRWFAPASTSLSDMKTLLAHYVAWAESDGLHRQVAAENLRRAGCEFEIKRRTG